MTVLTVQHNWRCRGAPLYLKPPISVNLSEAYVFVSSQKYANERFYCISSIQQEEFEAQLNASNVPSLVADLDLLKPIEEAKQSW